MKKLNWLMACALGLVSPLAAQTANPGQPANIGNTLYASAFGGWSVPQGNNGPYSWSYSSACTNANSGGVTFQPFTVGDPIRIVDSSNPALSENVTVQAVNITGSGCSISVNAVNNHQNFTLTSATAGLQEAINYSNQMIGLTSPAAVVLITPAWSKAGGVTSMILNAAGSNGVSLLDVRNAVLEPYIWNGTNYVATPFNGGGGGFTFSSTYNPGTIYTAGAVVTSGQSTYISLSAGNQGNTPPIYPATSSFWAAFADAPGAAASQISVTNTFDVAPPQSGVGDCAFLNGCFVYNTNLLGGAQMTDLYYAPYGGSVYNDTSYTKDTTHYSIFANLPQPTSFPSGTNPTVWWVTDCATTACTAGGGNIVEAFTNVTPGTWALAALGQGSGTGSNVECAVTVSGSATAVAAQTCQDETYFYLMTTGNNSITLSGYTYPYRMRFKWVQPNTGNATFTPPSNWHGAITVGTDALTASSQDYTVDTNGSDLYAANDGIQNMPTSFVSGSISVANTQTGTVPTNLMGIFWPKTMIMKSYCPLCGAGTGTAALRIIGYMNASKVTHVRILTSESGTVTTYVPGSAAHNTANNEFGNADLTNWANFVCAVNGLTFSWGINFLGQTNSAAAAEAVEINSLLGPSGSVCQNRLTAFEIGNEPDSSGYAAAGYTPSSFATAWASEASAIKTAVPTAQFVGPSTGQVADLSMILTPFMATNSSAVTWLTQHFYAQGNPPNATIGGLLNTTPNAGITITGNGLGAYGKQCEMNEGNTVPAGGQANVSNTFASAIWAMTNAYDFAQAGYTGGCTSTTLDYSADGSPFYANTFTQGYSPIIDGSAITYANPELTGIAFAGLIGAGTMESCTLTISGVNARCYVIKNTSSGNTYVIVVNQDTSKNAQFTITLPGSYTTASSLTMTAPSLSDIQAGDATIQGVAVGYGGSFTPGTPTAETITGGNTIVTLVSSPSVKVITVH